MVNFLPIALELQIYIGVNNSMILHEIFIVAYMQKDIKNSMGG